MDYPIFATAFIVQFVGHRLGDFFLQTGWQAMNKAANGLARFRHCVVYAGSISFLLVIIEDWGTCSIVFGLTFVEHMVIDSRKPIISWIMLLERRISNNKAFTVKQIPSFLMLEIDQTVHIVRIFILSILIAYNVI